MRISMAGDDCSLHFDLSELTPKQLEDHRSNQVLTGMLQVALLYIAKKDDVVCLYDSFQEPPWREALERYHNMFSELGLDPPVLSRVQYHPMEGFYESASETPSDATLENLYMVSHSNLPLHRDEIALATSQNLNSKVFFAEEAPRFGLPVPHTIHTTKGELPAVFPAFAEAHGAPLMLKTLGLAGARNVTTVENLQQALAYVAEYDDSVDVILQQRLDVPEFTEMTVDLFVSNEDIRITNVRQILFADGLWVGNLLGPGVSVSPEHEKILLSVGEFARRHGFKSDIGFNLGIDYFIREDDILITEINARWTGGLFPAELARRLKVLHQPVVAFIDLCPVDRFGEYLEFLESNLTAPGKAWGMAPMGFSPPVEMEGTDCLYVWQVVVGDFAEFQSARKASLPAEVMPTVPLIRLPL